MLNQGKVYLVGAGPGDPEFLTVKARRVLDEADVIVYDRLVSKEIMDLVPPGTARVSVGKQPRLHPVPQREINDMLLNLARLGRRVVRLKGGDPYLFGRGSEEAAHLRRHGIAVAAIPGVTSASACAAALGIPLTHRGYANGVRFITGHCCAENELDLDWPGLADPATTLVLYMGLANISQISIRLIANGLSATTPVAAICDGSRPEQCHIISTLGEIARVVAEADFGGPVLFVIGRVVELADVPGVAASDTEEPVPTMAREHA